MTLTGLQTGVKGARALASGEKLAVTKAADGTLTIAKPGKIDPISTAIVLNLAGPPVVTEATTVAAPSADGSYLLGAPSAILVGDTIALQGSGDDANLGYWTEGDDAAEWKLSVPPAAAGSYTAKLEYSCEPGTEGSTYAIRIDGADTGITMTVAATAGWSDYKIVTLPGTLALTPGAHTIRVAPTAKPGFAVMNLKRITLTKS
ncbi:hypothetical protein CCAX7_005900 [Capsulimonas corticalis]|uniref:Uncharacterized protein n=1 Tax=Capsulimonas corticalis TaxID=2219043 RepID=A0A402D3H5_9BACT|nr:carbohydrate-binding protein [Capsulimonas corticalis]BDI28539.1 hypothetical protein CCAX7_005900 [Capsulimonas corticalis]